MLPPHYLRTWQTYSWCHGHRIHSNWATACSMDNCVNLNFFICISGVSTLLCPYWKATTSVCADSDSIAVNLHEVFFSKTYLEPENLFNKIDPFSYLFDFIYWVKFLFRVMFSGFEKKQEGWQVCDHFVREILKRFKTSEFKC